MTLSEYGYTKNWNARRAFTLVEILVVLVIIAILLGLLFPALSAVMNSARKAEAASQATLLVNAIKAYNAEYGVYPLFTESDGSKQGFDTLYGDPGGLYSSPDLINILTASDQGVNSGHQHNRKRIVFIEVPEAKDPNNPRSGVDSNNRLLDPWGNEYLIAIDGDYDGQVDWYGFNHNDKDNPNMTVAIISMGKDGTLGKDGNRIYAGSDDVVTW